MGFDWKGKLEDLKDRLDVVKEKVLGHEEIQQPELLEGHMATIHGTIIGLWDAFQDGFDLGDIGAIAKATVTFIEIAEDLEGKTGAEKLEFVQDGALVIYRTWDPNIPVVWGALERTLERKAVHMAVKAIVDGCLSLVRRVKDQDKQINALSVTDAVDTEDETPAVDEMPDMSGDE